MWSWGNRSLDAAKSDIETLNSGGEVGEPETGWRAAKPSPHSHRGATSGTSEARLFGPRQPDQRAAGLAHERSLRRFSLRARPSACSDSALQLSAASLRARRPRIPTNVGRLKPAHGPIADRQARLVPPSITLAGAPDVYSDPGWHAAQRCRRDWLRAFQTERPPSTGG